jgi:hypothetical protein
MMFSFRKKKPDDGLVKLTPADPLIAAEKKLIAQQKEVLDSYRTSLKLNPSIETALAHAVVTMGGANIKDASFLYPFIAADLKATSMSLDLKTALANLDKIPVATCLSAIKVLFGLVYHINKTKDFGKINDLTVRLPVVLKTNAAEQFSAELKSFFASLPKGLSSMTLELTIDDNAATLSDEAIKAMLNAAGSQQIDLSLKNVRFSQDQYETQYLNKWQAASHSEEKVSFTRKGLIHDNCLMRRTSWNGQEIASASSPSAESRAMKQQ